jgi:DNA-binding MarR family transcriptional regulator
MPRLDAERVALFRQFCTTSDALRRDVEVQLMDEHDLPLAWFEVLASVRAAPLRVHELREQLQEVPSSLSRRLDRMEEEGFVVRAATPTATDRRAVTVTITPFGRVLWRDANVTYRRAVQDLFARRLTETDIAALHRVLGKAAT